MQGQKQQSTLRREDRVTKSIWPFLFREEAIDALDRAFRTSQEGTPQLVVVRRRETEEELQAERVGEPLDISAPRPTGRGLGKTRLLQEWSQRLSTKCISRIAIIPLLNIRPQLEARTIELKRLFVQDLLQFSTIWNRDNIRLFTKWVSTRIFVLVLTVWIGIVGAIVFLASVFQITGGLEISGESIIEFLLQNQIWVLCAAPIAFALSYIAYGSRPLQRARKKWSQSPLPGKWRKILADKGHPKQVTKMLLQCLRRDLTYVILVDDLDYADVASYDVVTQVFQAFAENGIRATLVLAYNRDNPRLTETMRYRMAELEMGEIPSARFVELLPFSEEQLTTIVATAFQTYGKTAAEEATGLCRQFFALYGKPVQTPEVQPPVSIDGRADLVLGFFDYLANQGQVNFIESEQASSVTFKINRENVATWFERFLAHPAQRYDKLMQTLHEQKDAGECLELLKWLLAHRCERISVNDLHALSRIGRMRLVTLIGFLSRQLGILTRYRLDHVGLDPEWRFLLDNHWANWNSHNDYTHQVFEHLLSKGNLSAQENVEEQALLANPCREAIEILYRKAQYLSDDMGHMGFSLRYFENALNKWEQLLATAREGNYENLLDLVRWHALTDYHPTPALAEEREVSQEITPLRLCEIIATVCLRVGKYERAEDLVNGDWPRIQKSLSSLELTSFWSEVERVAQKLEYLNAELMLRKGDWAKALEILSQGNFTDQETQLKAVRLGLSLKSHQCFGISFLALQYPVPSMDREARLLAEELLDSKKGNISHATGARMAAQVAIRDLFTALLRRERKVEVTDLDNIRVTLHEGTEELELVLHDSINRYDDFEVFRQLARYCTALSQLAYLCQVIARPNASDELATDALVIKAAGVLPVVRQLAGKDVGKIQEILALKTKEAPTSSGMIPDELIGLEEVSTQSGDLSSVLKGFTSTLVEVFERCSFLALDRAIRLGKHTGCLDDLPGLLAERNEFRMKTVGTLPEEAPGRKERLLEITAELREGLAIAERIGRVAGIEAICALLAVIYGQFHLHYSRTAEYSYKAAETCRQLGMPGLQVGFLYKETAVVHHNIGVLYPEQRQTLDPIIRECQLKAREHFLLAEQEEEYIQYYGDYLKSSIVKIDLDLAEQCLSQSQFEQAFLFANDLLARIPAPSTDLERKQRGWALVLRGEALLATGDEVRALNSYEKAYEIFRNFDLFYEIQSLRHVIRIVNPRHRYIAAPVTLMEQESRPAKEQVKEGQATGALEEGFSLPPQVAKKLKPGTEVALIYLGADPVTALWLVGQGDIDLPERLSRGEPLFIVSVPDSILDAKWNHYYPLLEETYDRILSTGLDHLQAEFRLELAEASTEIAFSAGLARPPDVKHLRDALHLYCSVGEGRKALDVLKVFLFPLALLYEGYLQKDFRADCTTLLQILREDEDVHIATQVFELWRQVEEGRFIEHVTPEDRQQTLVQAKALRDSGQIDRAFDLLTEELANTLESISTGPSESPYEPLDLDLAIAEELYSLLIEKDEPDQSAEVDKKRHYIEAARTALNLIQLAQDYESLRPQLALTLYRMTCEVKPETIHTQCARQEYYRLQDELSRLGAVVSEEPVYTVQASKRYYLSLMGKEKDRGDEFYKGNRYAEALECYEKGHELAIKLKNKERQSYCASQAGICLGYLGKHEEAIEYINEYRELCKDMDFNLGIATAEANLGWVFDLQGKPDEALAHYKSALEIRIQSGDEKEAARLQRVVKGLESRRTSDNTS